MNIKTIAGAALGALLLAGPAFAQTTTTPTTPNTGAGGNVTTNVIVLGTSAALAAAGALYLARRAREAQ